MKKHLSFKSNWIFGLTAFFIFTHLFSQTTLVAELSGNPLNTTDWTYLGGGGGGYVNADEFVFTDDLTAQQGAIYFSEPFNLNQCKKWRIEFEARLWGNGTPTYGNADGIAFWYLENPPENFTSGGGLGMPGDAKGIIVAMDTFNNTTEGSQSEVQVYYGQIIANPYEDNTTGMSYFNTLPLGVNVRNSNYQNVVIEWDDGLITVSIEGTEICSFSPTPYFGVENLTDGYFGFSGSTGAGTDRQSIRNVHVYMDVVQLNTSNTTIAACDANGDGFAQFDLTSEENNLINNPENYTIEYYANVTDMENENQISDPEHYVNEIQGGQTVYVIVRNSEDCFETAEIELIVNSMPTQENVETQYFCDEDGDGEITVDLTDYQSQFISGSLLGVTFQYYSDAALTNIIPTSDWNNYNITSFPHSVWIKAFKDFPSGDTCETNAEEIVFDLGQNLPINSDEFDLFNEPICVDENEEILIDLTQIQISFTDESGVFFQYYETQNQALIGGNDFIPDPENYPVANSGSVFVRLEKEGFCFSLIQINFEIAKNPVAESFVELPPKCDDDFDGFVDFDLDSEAVPQIVDDTAGLNFAYYLSENDAENHNNPQSPNVTIATGNTVSYWVVVSNGTCEVISEVQMEAAEGLDGLEQEIDAVEICDDDFDGIYELDLTQVEDEFLDNTNGISFSYFTDSGLTNQIPASQIQNYVINTNSTIWVLIFNGNCSATRSFEILIGNEVPHENPPFELTGICEATQIDLTEIESEILINSTTNIAYFASELNAQHDVNPILNPENFSPDDNSGTLYVRLEEPGFCPVVLPFDYEISPLPENPFGGFPILCFGDEIILDAGNDYPNENYEWVWDGGNFTGPEITITESGNYILTITSNNGCEREIPITIQASAAPVITHLEIGDTYISVEATGNGPLEYSLDGVLWQSEPRFSNLIPGEDYTIFVRENGCSITSKIAAIPLITNFISPNNDGYNDVWKVRGLENLQECNVKIFDRYGKIFVDSTPQDLNIVWNGKYKGDFVPSGDYWYIITAMDENSIPMKYVGHISVRNR